MNFCLIFFITGCLAITVLAGGGSYSPTSPPPTPPPSEDPSEDFSSDSSEESSSYFSENSSSSPSPSEDPKCKIIKKLEKCFPKEQLADWTCLVENESTFRTHIMSTNDNGSHDYGLFQINDGFWCKKGKKGGDCKMDCNKFLDDDITDDCACVKIIHKRHGFSAWNGWKKNCQGKKPPVPKCGPSTPLST